MSNIFKEFPQDNKCIICGTNDNKECVLVKLDHTYQDGICEATPVHVDCISNLIDKFVYNEKNKVFYTVI
jgi:hypothetical protein